MLNVAPTLTPPTSSSMRLPFLDQTLIIPTDQAPVYSMLGGGEARLFLTGEQTGGSSWMGSFREDPGFMTHLHYHAHTDEQFFVLDGVLSVYVDDAWQDLGPGTLGLLPRGKPHAQGNRGDTPVHFLASGAPAGFEKMFAAVDDLLQRHRPGTPEFQAAFGKICAACDITSLGPAPR